MWLFFHSVALTFAKQHGFVKTTPVVGAAELITFRLVALVVCSILSCIFRHRVNVLHDFLSDLFCSQYSEMHSNVVYWNPVLLYKLSPFLLWRSASGDSGLYFGMWLCATCVYNPSDSGATILTTYSITTVQRLKRQRYVMKYCLLTAKDNVMSYHNGKIISSLHFIYTLVSFVFV